MRSSRQRERTQNPKSSPAKSTRSKRGHKISSSDSSSSSASPVKNRITKKRYQCVICSKDFSRNYSLRRYIEEAHANKRKFTCDQCGYQSLRKQEMEKHVFWKHSKRNLRTLDKFRSFKCSKCPKRFPTKGTLRQHQEVHSDVRPFKCYFGQKFKNSRHLKVHQNNVH
jgi:uncharacterized Zn-finger protein